MKTSIDATCLKVAALSAGSLLVLLCFALPAFAQVTLTTDRAVNMHATSNGSSTVVAVVPSGTQVTMESERRRGSYFKVRFDQNKVGWVHGKHLLVPDEDASEETADVMSEPLEVTEAKIMAATAAAALRPLCGGERHYRWEAKATTSGFSQQPTSPSITTMLKWAALPFSGQDALSWCHAREGREAKPFSVVGWVRRTMTEDDGDVHVEITLKRDSAVDDCVVAEIPPAELSPKFAKARTDLASLLSVNAVTSKDFASPIQVRFTGLAFWDGWHLHGALPSKHGRCNSTKGATWELHPVFKVAAP